MQHLADLLPRVTQSLLDRSWLLTVFERKALATSDHPVYVVPNEDLTEMGMGTGIENAMVIHAPLTCRHSLATLLICLSLGDGLVIGADDITLDFNGHSVSGDAVEDPSDVGIRVTGHRDVRITSGTVQGFWRGRCL